MKKLIAATVAAILILTTAACQSGITTPTETSSAPNTTTTSMQYKGKQELTATELIKNEEDLSDRLFEVGLEDVSIDSTKSITFSDGTKGKVHLICDYNCFGESSIFHASYLAFETESKYIFEDISESYRGEVIYVNDLDGKKGDEIILCRATGGTALSHHGIVYKLENETLTKMFDSTNEEDSNTGFEGITKDGFMFEVTNEFTGYSTAFELNSNHYVDWYYDKNGKVIKEGKMGLVSFKKFEIDNKDCDDIYEIYAEQYAYLNSLSDTIGYTKCTIKFNTETNDFEVVDSEFISVYNMSDDYIVEQGKFYSAYKFDNRYYYKITSKDGSVREDVHDTVKLPNFNMLTDTLLEVKSQTGTGQSTNWAVYYDAEADKISNHFYYVMATNGELVAHCKLEENNIGVVVQNIFDVTEYCKRFDEFSSPISTDCTDQIQNVTFSEDGKSIEVVYLSGEDYTKTTQTFELY